MRQIIMSCIQSSGDAEVSNGVWLPSSTSFFCHQIPVTSTEISSLVYEIYKSDHSSFI